MKTILTNIPCTKSVTNTAIWPPIKTKNKANDINKNITTGNVDMLTDKKMKLSGRPQKYIMNLEPTDGKIPKLIIPARNASMPAKTLKFLLYRISKN